MKQDIVVLFIPTANSGTAYYRMWTWNLAAFRNRAFYAKCPFYESRRAETNDWEVNVSDPMYYGRIMAELDDAVRKADIIVIQMLHTIGSLNIFYSIKEAFPDKVVLAEIDDDILNTPEHNQASPFYKPGTPHREIALQQFKNSDGMIVSTPYLKELYSEFNKNIYIVENSLDFSLWNRVRNKKRKGQIRIGWIGGGGHDEDLRLVAPAVHNITKKYPDVRFVFVNGVPEFLKGLKNVEFEIGYEFINKYHYFFGSFGLDIGLAPLVDNSFTRGKSNLRWLEYSALKIPCVASNVGHYAQTLRDGEDVLFANNPEHFEQQIEVLIKDRSFRNALGHKAHTRAVRDFNVDVNIFNYEKTLRQAIELGPQVKLEIKEYEPQARVNIEQDDHVISDDQVIEANA